MRSWNCTPNWFLRNLTTADQLAPGILSETLLAGAKRQQTLAAALALCGDDKQNDHLSTELSETLRFTKTSELLSIVRNDLHPQYGSLIGNAKHGILDAQLYRSLATWMDHNPSLQALKSLRHGPPLTEESLVILDTLDDVAHSATVLSLMLNRQMAQNLNDEIRIIRKLAPDLFRQELSGAIQAMCKEAKHSIDDGLTSETRSWYGVDGLFERLTHKARFPNPPLQPHPNLIPLDSPKALKRAGHSMRNCAERLIRHVVLGVDYYYLWVSPETQVPEAFIGLESKGVLWRVDEIRGKANADLEQETLKQIECDLEQSGAICVDEIPISFLDRYFREES
jgi:hypothetical protein